MALPNVWVIFITTFDPFGANRMVYTIRNHCVELPEMDYDDGAVTLYLYVYGKEGRVSEKLRELLMYFANTNREYACNPELAALQSCIDDIKTDSRIKEAYMDLAEYIEFECNEATEEIQAERDDAIAERDDAIAERNDAIAERDEATAKLDAALCQINEMKAEIKILQEKLFSLKM